jgi:hypothetical protein
VGDALDQALSLIEQHPDRSYFRGPRDENVVGAAEDRLGLRFPDAYRRFVLRMGAGSFGAAEFYGVIDSDFSGPVPDGVWVTLESRKGPSALPTSMVVIGQDGMGGQYVLDTAAGDDPAVTVWIGGMSSPGEPLEEVASDFAEFVLDSVTRQVTGGSR